MSRKQTNYEKGRRIEWQARDHLVMQGFVVVRSAGSKGPIDLVGIGPQDLKLVSVTLQGEDLNSRREALLGVPAPACTIRELWVKIPYKGWQIEVVDGK